MRSVVRLSAGQLRLELEPELGGCVSAFRRLDFDLMRPLTAPASERPHALYSGMFPMVPFANSVRDNSFAIDGKHYALAPNMPGAYLNYHGSGWQLPWRVASRGPSSCNIVLDPVEETAGYRFSARQSFQLFDDRLEVEIEVTNRSETRMPFGFGLHPWFPRQGDAIVSFLATAYLEEGQDFQALAFASIPPGMDYSAGREPPRRYQNRCYGGWNGRARIDWRQAGISLAIEAPPIFEHLMFHVPASDPDTFCLEPQSNRTSAFDGVDEGRPASGVHILAPGEAVGGKVVFRVTARA